mgnify:CR=1 FL=1
MAILDNVASLVASVAGPLLFKPGAVVARGEAAQDGRGGFTYVDDVHEVELLRLEEGKGSEAGGPTQAGKSASFLILGDGLPDAVKPGAYIAFENLAYAIISTTLDPARAVLECSCELVGTATGIAGALEIILEGQ